MKSWQEILKGNLAYPKWNMLTLTISSIWSVVYQNFVWYPLCILFTSFGLWLFQTWSCDAESMSGWCPESLWCWFPWGPRLASSQPDFVMSLSTYCAGYRRKGTTLIFRNLHTKNGNTQYGMCNCCYHHIGSRKGTLWLVDTFEEHGDIRLFCTFLQHFCLSDTSFHNINVYSNADNKCVSCWAIYYCQMLHSFKYLE